MTERQKRFCEEYLVDLCAARAARRAGYAESTALSSAPTWINPEHPSRPELRREIDRLLAERAKQTRVSANGVVRELTRIAFDGQDEAAEEGAAPARPKGSADVRTQDRLRALELLGKHLGIFTEHLAVEQAQPVIVDEFEGPGESEGPAEAEVADETEGGGGDE